VKYNATLYEAADVLVQVKLNHITISVASEVDASYGSRSFRVYRCFCLRTAMLFRGRSHRRKRVEEEQRNDEIENKIDCSLLILFLLLQQLNQSFSLSCFLIDKKFFFCTLAAPALG
jgi:hypothetical protein